MPKTMNPSLLFLPVDKVCFKDLFDWSIPVERCKTTNVVLSAAYSPRKNGINMLKKKKNVGCRTRTNERDIALFRFKDKVFAVHAECPHAGGPLDLGDIEELGDHLCVKCPWHGWKIDLDTGCVLEPQSHNNQAARVYPVKVEEDGRLFIGFDGLDSSYFNLEELEF